MHFNSKITPTNDTNYSCHMLQKVLPQLPVSVSAAPYCCSDNIWNTFLHPYSVTAKLLGCYVNTITVLTHI